MREATFALVTLSVPDISCAHCARAIESALAPVAGVQSVAVDIPGQAVQVAYDTESVTLDRIGEILADAGYPVASVDTLNGSATR